jgi:Mrp family chromosome partitioning ATPase
VLGAPLLGEIPRLPARRRAKDLSLDSVGPAAAEAYHFAVASLEHALASIGDTTVALTSAAPGDGKTTTALFLAIAAGHEHRRVRLVDADERTRRLTALCDQVGAPELVDLRTDYAASFDGDPDREEPPLPAELARLHPSGFFRAHAFRKLLLAVSELADLVLIDTPAILAVAPAVAIAEQANAVVVVISRGTSIAQLEALKLRLSFIDTPILGYIFTRGTNASSPYADNYAQPDRAVSAAGRIAPPLPVPSQGRLMMPVRIAAVLAAYNRRELTLACLASLQAQQVPGVVLYTFALDDASSDGTADAVAERFPDTVLLHGDGQQYWAGGMCQAFAAAGAGPGRARRRLADVGLLGAAGSWRRLLMLAVGPTEPVAAGGLHLARPCHLAGRGR